jgi:sugar/nucleoside kinase (ribokinase family)
VQVGTDNAAVVHRARGGSAANVAALSAARIPTRFIGRVGDDPAGHALVAEVTACGVEALVSTGGRTGTVVVLVDHAGERTMFPDRAASAELIQVPVEWLADTTVLHVPAVPVEQVLDTTGAVDAFAAGFLAAWIAGEDPLAACAAGYRCASLVLSTPGAARG